MKLQESILSTFKRHYPALTLNEASKLLNINRTRLFRILNGQEMKISEYESFEFTILKAQGVSNTNFLYTAKDCLKNLRPEKINLLFNQMNEKLFINAMITQ